MSLKADPRPHVAHSILSAVDHQKSTVARAPGPSNGSAFLKASPGLPGIDLTVTRGFSLHPGLSAMFSLLVLALLSWLISCVRADYQAFLRLGPGGTPSTFRGYLRVTRLKWLHSRKGRAVYEPPALNGYEHPASPWLTSLAAREDKGGHVGRPKTAGMAPHRQVSQRPPVEMRNRLSQALCNFQEVNKDKVILSIACFERYDPGLFFRPKVSRPTSTTVSTGPHAEPPSLHSHGLHICPFNHSLGSSPINKTCRRQSHPYIRPTSLVSAITTPASILASLDTTTTQVGEEIFHMHSADNGSSHLALHPLDAKMVIERGWGEMHPLAGRGPWVPRTFTLIYAPRDEKELEVVFEIVRAGAWWVGGIVLQPVEKDAEARKEGEKKY